MIRINIHQAKVHLSRYLDQLEPGERILLCRRNVPVAEIRALPSGREESRPFGGARGMFEVPDDFNAPLPEAELESWYR